MSGTVRIQQAPPGYPGSPLSPFGAPFTIPAGRPYTIPKGAWIVLTGPNDIIQIVLSGTSTVPLVPSGLASPYVVSDGANVQIGGTGTTTQLVQVF